MRTGQVASKYKKKPTEEERKSSSSSSRFLIDLSSNDYLGFARSQKLRESIDREWQKMAEEASGFTSASINSRLVTGNREYCEQLEYDIARFHRAEAGLIFNTGYMANLGLVSSLTDDGDTILYDLNVHASLQDGMRLSGAHCLPFRHNDCNHLEKKLKACQGKTYVCIESIYSFDGTQAPLKKIAEICHQYNASLIVDEAHATGITGENGEGLVCQHNLENEVFARVHPFGKALGSHGAIVLGSKVLRSHLINFARSFIYSTALPPQVLAGIKCAYERLPLASGERQQLEMLKIKFAEFARSFQIFLPFPESPSIFFPVGDGQKTKALSNSLASAGIDVKPILSPTVKRGKECLRICLHAFNTEDEIFHLLRHLSAKK